MNINQSIAKRAYLATDEQVRALALLNVESNTAVAATAGTFLRIEVASLQDALGMQPRIRAGRVKSEKLEQSAVLQALKEVHERLYSLVLSAVCTDDILDKPKLRKPERKRRALERNRRSNFARSAKATLAAYIRAGGNVAALVVPSVTKSGLQQQTAKLRPVTHESAEDKAHKIAARLAGHVERIREDDHELAQIVAQKLTQHLADVACGDKTTKSPQKAMDQMIPLEMEAGIFLPMPAANEQRIEQRAH